ncbi:putative MFS family arabinose efflux permease [Kineococcus xinjiangensis]|uniref:Putative MFS family arabinose efflux permease n=1 Tax=Kineococcus xinjiangensis TaxID=512762 RepID=A0A2S6IT77_9ACTN|nr:MFS transporter [Kineococcus xinjiangensis]PPK97457.1 putative MFS family arabinose efflux permease [Kineococcus xinjiangensis]
MGSREDHASGMTTYAAVLRNPRAARPFAAAVLARLPIAMAPLGLVLLVEELRDSYALAGVVAGAFAIGAAIGSPLWGRALDRFGQPRVVLASALPSAALLTVLTLVTATAAHDAALPALAVLVGLTFPPISPAMRAAWRVVLPDLKQQRAGYALDAVAVETIFVGGPLLLTLLLAFFDPLVPTLVTAGLQATGALLYSRTHAARTWRPAPGEHAGPGGSAPGEAALPWYRRTVALVAGIPIALSVMAAMSVGFGLLDVSLAAVAEKVLGSSDQLGYLFAAIAGGSAVGGLLYGGRNWTGPERRRLPVCLGGFGVLLGVTAIVVGDGDPSLTVLLPVLFCTGLFISPNLIILGALIDELAPAHRVNEAQAWLSTGVTAGAAVGNALAGLLIEASGPVRSMTFASAAVCTAALLALLAQARWRRLSAARTTRSHDAATESAPA